MPVLSLCDLLIASSTHPPYAFDRDNFSAFDNFSSVHPQIDVLQEASRFTESY